MEPFPHVTEQSATHFTLQVEPSLQLTLPLLPTVAEQLELPAQEMLHDSPQVPLQWL